MGGAAPSRIIPKQPKQDMDSATIAIVGSVLPGYALISGRLQGTRGRASILFMLLIVEDADIVHRSGILSITVMTVTLSMALHGVSAMPLPKLYSRLAGRGGDFEKTKAVSDIALRGGFASHGNTEH